MAQRESDTLPCKSSDGFKLVTGRYAAMFPVHTYRVDVFELTTDFLYKDKINRMVLDGVVDAEDYYSGRSFVLFTQVK